jgi:hypothetical protein
MVTLSLDIGTFMKKFICSFLMFIAPQFVFSADLLYRQSFETPVESNPEIVWTSHGYPLSQAIVTNNPKHGEKSVRGNFNPNVVDPITKMKGDTFPHFILDFHKLPALKNHLSSDKEVYVSWWFKLDKCLWKGSTFSNTDPLQARAKFAYVRMGQDPATSYYFSVQGGSKGTGVFQANSDNWISLWQKLYGAAALWTDNGRPYGPDGQWHKLSFYIGKDLIGQKHLMWWIDDELMKKERYESSSKYKIFNDFKMDSIQFWITKKGELDASENVEDGNYCNGWQIDDVQIWSGLPHRPKPPFVN